MLVSFRFSHLGPDLGVISLIRLLSYLVVSFKINLLSNVAIVVVGSPLNTASVTSRLIFYL